jgi:predicted membrane channel-forming protein YqfA (hemolysin III family)
VKTLFVVSLVCALTSLLAVVGVFAMTIVPGPGAANDRGWMMLVAGGFAVVWLSLAFWARPRRCAASQSPAPGWLIGLLVCAGISYSLGMVLFFLG